MSGAEPIIAGMAGRYATALFELAREARRIKQVGADLTAFTAMLDASPELTRLVRSPVFSAAEQKRALAAVLKRAGIEGIVAKFLGLVAANRRLFAIRDMIGGFHALAARHRGEVTAEVVSTTKLSANQTKALKSALKAAIGQEIQVSTAVDPGLLGGLVVKVGSRMIDTSLRTKLNNLKFAMKEVG